MSQQDQTKWNKKYQTTPTLLKHREPSIKLINLVKQLNITNDFQALDIACGIGKNTLYLAKHNIDVEALDISDFAIDKIKEKNISNITTKVVDLEGYIPQQNSYDLIVMTNYLDRELIPNLIEALKVDGILYIETYMHHETNNKPGSNPDFLLQENELKKFFNNNFEILDYDEFDNDKSELYRMRKQSIIAKKIK